MNKSESIVEKWMPVKGYEGIYEISNNGLMKSKDRLVPHYLSGTQKIKGAKMNPSKNIKGYLTVDLRKNGSRKFFTVHRLVAIHFLGEPPAKDYTVNHIDGIKTNNSVENLEWMTLEENMKHAHKNGLKFTKYDDDVVFKIRKLHKETNLKQKEIGKMCGVSQRYVSSIINNRRRIHAKELTK